MLEGLITYSHIRMAPSPRLSYLVTNQAPPFPEWHSVLTSDHVGTNPTVTSDSTLTSDMEGTNPLTMTDWLSPYI